MKYTLNKTEFINLFDQYGRSNNFSREAREVLFDYFEEAGEDSGEDYECDIIAICCDYVESSVEDVILDYSLEDDVENMDDDDEKLEYVREYLQERTTLIGETSTCFVFASF